MSSAGAGQPHAPDGPSVPNGQTQASDGRPPAPEGHRQPRHRRWLPRTVRHLAELLIVGFLIEYFVVPQIGGTHDAIHVLSRVNPWLPLAGFALEAASLGAYFALTRALLPKQSDPGLVTISRIEMTTLALSHCVPGGNAVGYSLAYRLMTKAGVSGTDTGFALATQGLGSAVVLNVIFWLALLVSLPLYGFQLLYLFVAIAGLMLMALLAGIVVLFTKGDERALSVVEGISARLPFLGPQTLPHLFTQLAQRVQHLSRDRRQMGTALLLAAGNWLFDAASLWVFVGAFGYWVNPVGLLVAYGIANILAAVPITPGGLGVVETALSGLLVGFGAPRTVAILGVIGYRLVNFWLPIPLGGLSYLSLRVRPPPDDEAERVARRAVWRARWHSLAELFGGETPRPVPATTLPGITSDHGPNGHASGQEGTPVPPPVAD